MQFSEILSQPTIPVVARHRSKYMRNGKNYAQNVCYKNSANTHMLCFAFQKQKYLTK